MIVSFIIRLRHQSILSVSRDCTLYLLFNYQKLYLLVFFLFKNKLDKLFFKEFKNIYKGAFVLGKNDFKKSFSPKPRCLAATVNFIFRKMASCWPKFSPLTRKWFYTLIFTSNHFRKKRERERRESPDRRAPIVDRRAVRSSDEHARRSTSGAIVQWACSTIAMLVDRDRRSRRRSQSREDRDRAVFSFFWVCLDLSFPSSSPNTRKYFSEIFLKCNQTHENIFLSGKWNIFRKCF